MSALLKTINNDCTQNFLPAAPVAAVVSSQTFIERTMNDLGVRTLLEKNLKLEAEIKIRDQRIITLEQDNLIQQHKLNKQIIENKKLVGILDGFKALLSRKNMALTPLTEELHALSRNQQETKKEMDELQISQLLTAGTIENLQKSVGSHLPDLIEMKEKMEMLNKNLKALGLRADQAKGCVIL